MGTGDLLIVTERGLFCPAGDFYIDPWQPVERAVVTHAHGDHLIPGCGEYVCSRRGAGVTRARLTGATDEPESAPIHGLEFGEPREFGGVRVTLVPAGHILGSAQVRVEGPGGAVWVVSGDYKTEADRTCDPFTPVACDVFITESTFGLPIYRWRPEAEVFAAINAWWRHNAAQGRTSIVFAYALGKAQRVLSGLDPGIGPIAAHGAVFRMNEEYRAAGIRLPEAPYADEPTIERVRGPGLVLAPPSALGSPWVRRFGELSGACASGWMQVRGGGRRSTAGSCSRTTPIGRGCSRRSARPGQGGSA